MSRNLQQEFENLIKGNQIIAFIKGTKLWPQCGYSAKALDILNFHNIEYEIYDILKDPELRSNIPTFSNWPTYPQIYVKGELIGGCDILEKLHESGELATILQT